MPYTLKRTRELGALTGSRRTIMHLHVVDAGTSLPVPSYWDGGSRDEWKVVTRSGNTTYLAATPFLGKVATHVIVPGAVLVRTGTFRGKPAQPALYCTRATAIHLCTTWGCSHLATVLREGLSADELVALDAELETIQ